MGRDKHERYRVEARAPIVPVVKDTLDEPAWRAMSHGAKVLYIALKRRVSKGALNNGKVFLSQRDAAEELRSHHNQIARWYRELQHYGFIVQMTAGYLGMEGKGVSPHWRLTEHGYMREPPTQDYKRWDGVKFSDKKTDSRAGKGAHSVPEKAHTPVQEKAHTCERKRAGIGAHRTNRHRAGNGAHTSITTGRGPDGLLPALSPLFLLSALLMVRAEKGMALLVLMQASSTEFRAAA
ncbi:MAG TPA: hypothetical protein VHG92_15265 [Afifellaceae bacterium]|nr:hypothetical protein [Afifellaceae bacterium]